MRTRSKDGRLPANEKDLRRETESMISDPDTELVW